MKLSPIVLFVYNRPEITRKTLNALSKNLLADQSELYIYCDGPKINAKETDLEKIILVRKIVKEKAWCKNVTIIESVTNKGLAKSIIYGVSEIIKKHGKIIVLEDDIYTSKYFLEYMNDALQRYAFFDKIFVIVGYNYPIKIKFKDRAYFSIASSCHGWATWERAWKYFEEIPQEYKNLQNDSNMRYLFDLDDSYPYSEMLRLQMEEDIDSWAIRWWWSVFKNKGLSLFPDKTLIANIGFNSEAVHTKKVLKGYNKYFNENNKVRIFPNKVIVDMDFYCKQKQYLKTLNKLTFAQKIGKLVRFIFKKIKKTLQRNKSINI